MGPHELSRAKGHFAKLTKENAQRLLRFWQVRPDDRGRTTDDGRRTNDELL